MTPRRRSRLRLAWSVPLWASVAVWALFTGWRLLLPDLVWPAVVAVAYTPYVAPAGLLPIVVSVVSRAWWRGAVLAGCVLALTVALLPRALPDVPSGTGPTVRITVLNVLGGGADPEAVVALAENTDLLILVELTVAGETALDRAGLAEALPYRVSRPTDWADGTGIRSRLRLAPAPELEPHGGNAMPAARVTVPGAATLELVAVHPVAPDTPEHLDDWRHDLAAPPAAGPSRVLAGDFNATLDHASLRTLLDTGYRDAAATTGDGLTGTWWPAGWLPPVVLDHVFTGPDVAALDTRVDRVPGTDHAAVTVTVRLPAVGERD